ncbi:Ankyrin repeat family protein [Zostera marina]|uniref:Ankyrin repeat family protein n=1 Tax=Zostera marina TaxID=29655 RepID=A0A0K9NT68_ZOSMR|nr:Ankyrin repeat family protein [Zostera marina]
MATADPPAFQEAFCCDVCKCSFNAFRRRHHCRCCGRTLCRDHSLDQMALPQFGIYSNVRVCSDCFNSTSRPKKDDPPAYFPSVRDTTDKMSRLNVGDIRINDAKSVSAVKNLPVVEDCKCGMPLCICEAPLPDPVLVPAKKTAVSVQSNSKPKKNISTQKTSTSISTNAPSSSNAKPSVFFNLGGQTSDVDMNKSNTHYELNGEGLREAIKNDHTAAVKRLLNEGVDANYRDRQGLTLLHLATVFNRTEITFILMDHGAKLDSKNAQGETPLDCAPTMLQHKIWQKIQEGNT